MKFIATAALVATVSANTYDFMGEGRVEGGLEVDEEVVLTHEVVGVGRDGGSEGSGGEEFHLKK